jgi:hypothetical protein
MRAHAGQDVMRVLPCGGGEDEAGVGVDGGEDIHAHALAGDKAVALGGVDWKGAADGNALVAKRLCEPALQVLLCRPADLIGGLPQVTAGDEDNLFYR